MGPNNVAVIDVAASQVTKRITVKQAPGHMAISPDGRRLYVANVGSGTLTVLETARGEVIGTVRVGNEPHGVAVSPDGTRAYVSSREDGTVAVVDTGPMAVVQRVSGRTRCRELGGGAEDRRRKRATSNCIRSRPLRLGGSTKTE
jgi:YVTN family beta-propeller protein